MPTESIEDILSEEEHRDEWKKRLEQLDGSRRERLERLHAALQKLSGLIPPEGQVLSPTSQLEFANEKMAVRRTLLENGLSQSIEKVAQRMSAASDRNLQVAAALLAQESANGVLGALQQIGRRPLQRDPDDPGLVCQSEIFRHFRSLLWRIVKLQDFPEHAESVELQRKLWPLPPRPASAELPAAPNENRCAAAVAANAGEPEREGADLPTFPKVAGKRGPRFDHWAFGMETEGIWHLFRRATESGRPHWRYQRKVRGLSRGKLQQIMQALAEGEGFVSRANLAKLIFKAPFRERSKYKGQVLTALSRLRIVIRTNVDCRTKANPLPWDKCQQGWRAEIQIGYAIQEESGLEFRTFSALQP
jgi:hypothetical protein